MASTKNRTSLWSNNSLGAGSADESTSWQDLSDGYGAVVHVRLTNDSSAPTVPAQVQIQVAAEYNAGSPTLGVNYGGPLVGNTDNNGEESWSVRLPPEVAAFRLVAGSNTGEQVFVDADFAEITALS